jgi:hypothetical protein
MRRNMHLDETFTKGHVAKILKIRINKGKEL